MQGFIKLHRSIVEWEWYKDSNTMRVFLHLLLKANHKSKKWQGQTIEAGSFITSYENLSVETGLSVQQIRTAINKLKSTSEITYKSTSRNSIITINNWNEYQENNTQINKQITSNQQANNKQITTTKNDKNDKNSSSSVVIEDENKNCFYGEYNNVYLTFEQYSKLQAMILNDDTLNELINDLSCEIEAGNEKYKKYSAEFPNAHYIHLKNFWKHRSYTGLKTKAKSTATNPINTRGYNYGY